MPTPFDPQVVLNLPLMAILGTVAQDGSPRTAPVWYVWEDGALWMLSDESASSAHRIRHDPRVSVEITDYDNAAGRLRHLGLRGKATLEPMDTDLFCRLLHRYLGDEASWNAWFIRNIARIDDPSGRLIRLVPESTFTNDISYFRTGPDLATDT